MTKKESVDRFEFDLPGIFTIVYLTLWTAAFFDMKPVRMPEVVKEQNVAIQIYERIEESVEHGKVLAKECERTQARQSPACQGVVELSKSISQLQAINPKMRFMVVEREFRTSKQTTDVINNASLLRSTAHEITEGLQIYWMGD